MMSKRETETETETMDSDIESEGSERSYRTSERKRKRQKKSHQNPPGKNSNTSPSVSSSQTSGIERGGCKRKPSRSPPRNRHKRNRPQETEEPTPANKPYYTNEAEKHLDFTSGEDFEEKWGKFVPQDIVKMVHHISGSKVKVFELFGKSKEFPSEDDLKDLPEEVIAKSKDCDEDICLLPDELEKAERSIRSRCRLWSTKAADLNGNGFMRNMLFFLHEAGINYPSSSGNETNKLPFVFVRKEYMRFYASLKYYLNDVDSENGLWFPITVHGMSNTGKSTLMWTSVEMIHEIFEDIALGGLIIDMFRTRTMGDDVPDATYVFVKPATSRARLFKFNYRDVPPASAPTVLGALTKEWLDTKVDGKENRHTWVHFSDGKRVKSDAEGKCLKNVVFSSSHSAEDPEEKKYKFGFLLSPWSMEEVLRVWVLLGHRLCKDFLPNSIKKRYCITPSTLAFRWKMFGGNIGCIFPENQELASAGFTTVSQIGKWFEKLNSKPVVANPDSKQTMVASRGGGVSDSIQPQTNHDKDWIMLLRDEKGTPKVFNKMEIDAAEEEYNGYLQPHEKNQGFCWERYKQGGQTDFFLKKLVPIHLTKLESLSTLRPGFYECSIKERKFVSEGA